MSSSQEPPAESPPTLNGHLAPGQTVGGGRYCLQEALGQGGMAVVWLAEDRLLHEPVALKFLPPQIQFDPSGMEGLRRETIQSRKLSHPNIVRIHDLHDGEGEPVFISMEYVQGDNLHVLRGRTPDCLFRWEEVRPWLHQLCDALAYAHDEGVIHRDLKPGNLMVDRNGRLKLADFGLARVVSDTMTRLSGETSTSGTVIYMSPQQADGRRPTLSDDLYSLGATVYELLAGHPPFHSGDIGYQIRHATPLPIEESLKEDKKLNDVPGHISRLILDCLEKDPERRPRSAREIQDRIQATATSALVAPPAAKEPDVVAVSPVARDDTMEVATVPESRPRFRRPLTWALLALLLPLAAVGLKQLSPNAASTANGFQAEPGFALIFNGENLEGWRGEAGRWQVRNGEITAFTTPEGVTRRHNTCLIFDQPVEDFELRLEFRLEDVMPGKPANSGIMYRARSIGGWEVRGFQFDLNGRHTGKLLLLEGGSDEWSNWGESSVIQFQGGKAQFTSSGIVTEAGRFDSVIRFGEWNELRLVARGNRLTHWINGVITAEVVDKSDYAPAHNGLLAIELKRATKLRMRNIRMKTDF